MNKILFATFLILLSAINVYGSEERGNIHVTIEGLKSSEGYVRIRLYNSKDGFPRSGEKALATERVKIGKGKAQSTFRDLPYGDYAIGILHDENGNDRMDLKWGFFPSEGAGVSNNPKPGLVPPSFEEAKVSLKKSDLKLNINIYY